jgi:4-amino-4-deoxy-L-arabinose transferase-like glycosyltransferase
MTSAALWRWFCVDETRRSLSLPAYAALLLVAVLTLGPGLASIPVMDRDEARYAQASKQMLASGNYVDIRFQDQPRHVKPIGTYWLQAASAAALGGVEAPILAYRLPSFLAAVGAVLLTAWFGARTFGATVGLAAGLLLASALVLQVEARTAKTDALLLLATLAAQVALARIALGPREGEGRFVGAPLVFWAAQGVGLMIKGPIITLVSGTTLLVFALWQRDRDLLTRLRFGPGLLLMLAVVAPWLILITIKSGLGFFEQSIGHALLGKVAQGDNSHGAPPGYHTLLLPLTFWPGIVLGALAAASGWRRRREPAVRFLLAWIVPTWLVFEAVVTKLPHYTLPVFPAVALLLALGLKDAAGLLATRWVRWFHLSLIALFGLSSLALAAVPLLASLLLDASWAITATGLLASAAGGLVLLAGVRLGRDPAPARLLPLVLAVLLFYGLTFQVVLPGTHQLWPSARVAVKVARLEGCQEIQVATAGYPEPSAVFQFGTGTLLGTTGQAAADHLLAHPECGLAVVERSQRDGFDHTLEAAGQTVRRLGTVVGLNVSKGKPVRLDLLTLAASALKRPAHPTRHVEKTWD